MKTLLITGTDTNVGKTYVTCLLLKQLREAGILVGAYKPVCSGAEASESGPRWNDVDELQAALGGQHEVDLICPQRFSAAVAPNVAAGMEGKTVDDRLLRMGAEAWRNKCDVLIVEGAGGLSCPLSNSSTVLDLAVALKAPLLIVAANRLGVINHSLLTVAAARQRGLSIAGVVLNESANCPPGDQSARDTNSNQLRHWLPGIPLFIGDSGGQTLKRDGNAVLSSTATDFFE